MTAKVQQGIDTSQAIRQGKIVILMNDALEPKTALLKLAFSPHQHPALLHMLEKMAQSVLLLWKNGRSRAILQNNTHKKGF
ncbi:hypothetical protein [Candidatus Desulfovibrio trichonymphae]|uniref:hypothetical protein n=1 Tax=Candidatus Desulfovibrio trichonymphae TaxID=1725232 RepID=UPI000BBB4228|nr:hypothetical protein [Candidatus Desulfovibrio trichonymphae]GHU99230.1 hypothetical protein AGMMS50248_07040 [Deltaproteobacteria bacterium]